MNRKGLLPIYGRITIKGIRGDFSTSFEVEPSNFKLNRIIANGDENLIFLADLYEQFKADCTDKLIKLSVSSQDVGSFSNTAIKELREIVATYFTKQREHKAFQKHKQIVTRIEGVKKERRSQKLREMGSFREIAEEFLNKQKQLIDIDFCYKSWKRKEKSVAIILQFNKKRFNRNDLFVSEIREPFFNDLQLYCKAELKWSQAYFRRTAIHLKAILNYAVVSDYASKNYLSHIKIKRGDKKSGIKHLSVEQLRLLRSASVNSHTQQFVRDCFLFQCYTGLAYVDLYKFSIDNVHSKLDGTRFISIDRQKTGNNSLIPLLPEAIEIINRYSDLNHRVDPAIKNPGVLPVYTNQTMNRVLKDIAVIANLPTDLLTTHVARKTFATLLISNSNISMESVSKMLGHTEQKTTSKFYAQVNNGRIFEEMKDFSFNNLLNQN